MIDRLENIGFYTLSNDRVSQASVSSPLWRCELLLTDVCNFKCPYCRGLREDCKGTYTLAQAERIVDYWIDEGLQNIRFSGGEPSLFRTLRYLVAKCKHKNVKHIAISTNGSATTNYYRELIELGVNDFSISLDACCSSFGKQMCGVDHAWEKVVNNIKLLSELTYVTVGIVFNEVNVAQAKDIVWYAHDLGVSDIRVISSAQYNQAIEGLSAIDCLLLEKHPILKYRVTNFIKGIPIRGISEKDNGLCPLVLDDMAVAGNYHFPCIIYLREQGEPIGTLDDLSKIRKDRAKWAATHNCYDDPICRGNCLDVCVAYNNKFKTDRKQEEL
jgi:MoaA/NifB/PqqE/SkfB family radical SAM enzyme